MTTTTHFQSDTDHTHTCATCGNEAEQCLTPNEECNDYPGDCADCTRREMNR